MSISILDLETLAQPAEVVLKNLPPWDESEARQRVPKNYKKEEAISGWLNEDQANHGKDAIEKAALNPEHSTIAIVGFWKEGRVEQLFVRDNSPKGEIYISGSDEDCQISFQSEPELIEHAFMRLKGAGFQDDPVLGWNLPFDIKLLVRRAWILGVPVPTSIFNPLSRYPVPERFVCMMDRYRAGSFKDPYTSLNNALRSVGLPEKGDGKEFGKLWQEDRAAALEYSRNELCLQAQLYRKMGVKL